MTYSIRLGRMVYISGRDGYIRIVPLYERGVSLAKLRKFLERYEYLMHFQTSMD